MYTQLAPNQQAALGTTCPKCGKGNIFQQPGRTGPTAGCSNCGHKINRPRRRGFSKHNPNPESSEGRLRRNQAADAMRDNPPPSPQSGDTQQSAAPQHQQEQEPQHEMQMSSNGTPLHAAFREVQRRILAGFRNLLLVGPSGSGKSTLFFQVAAWLAEREDHAVPPRLLSFTSGLTEGKLIGYGDIHGHYVPGYFVASYEDGGVFGGDEFDAADANVVLSLNAAIENGHLSLPSRIDRPSACRHVNFCFICMANTFGWGADIRYVGRNQLDASTISRFAGAIVPVDYDLALEERLTPSKATFRKAFWNARQNVAAHKLRRVWGTRELLAGARLLNAGYSTAEAFTVLTHGWTEDEKHKLATTVSA